MQTKWTLSLVLMLWGLSLFGQRTAPGSDHKGVLLSRFTYGAQLPGGDLSQRFGPNFIAGGGLDWQWGAQNWIIGLDAQYLFSNTVKEDPLLGLRTKEGFIIGNDREVADIVLRQRGFYVGALFGRVFPLSSKASSRAGLRLSVGSGLLQHRIRIQDDPLRGVAALSEANKKGYDRLSNGWCFQQFVGYQAMSKDRRSNFLFGIELFQGLTRSRRSFDFALQQRDNRSRLDLLFGLRLGWILPFYADKADEIYY